MKNNCSYCGKRIKQNRLWCSLDCKVAYFEKKKKKRDKTYIPKEEKRKKQRYELKDIISNEQLEAMIKEVDNNIEKRMKS